MKRVAYMAVSGAITQSLVIVSVAFNTGHWKNGNQGQVMTRHGVENGRRQHAPNLSKKLITIPKGVEKGCGLLKASFLEDDLQPCTPDPFMSHIAQPEWRLPLFKAGREHIKLVPVPSYSS
jgi:hypothetical protein